MAWQVFAKPVAWAAESAAMMRAAVACPSCGSEPVQVLQRWQQCQDLAIVWLYPDPCRLDTVIEKFHCARCQPHRHVAAIGCPLCGDGPLLAGTLAEQTPDPASPPEPVRHWLTQQGWHDTPENGLVCGQH